MTWLQRYRVRYYLRNSMWIYPLLGVAAALGFVRVLHHVEGAMGWVSDIPPETARAVLGTMAASMFTFVVFVSSALLVAVQLADAQLTPRVIAFVFRDPVTKGSLTLFVFTFTFCLATLVRVTDSVPLLTGYVAAYGSVVSLAVFLYLIDHVGHIVRTSGGIRSVARQGRQVIEQVYPRPFSQRPPFPSATAEERGGSPTHTIPSRWDGVVLAFDFEGLVARRGRPTVSSSWCPRWGTPSRKAIPCFGSSGAGPSAGGCPVPVGRRRPGADP